MYNIKRSWYRILITVELSGVCQTPLTGQQCVCVFWGCSVHRSKRVTRWWYLPAAWHENAAHYITRIGYHLFTKVCCIERSRKLCNFPYVRSCGKTYELAFCLFWRRFVLLLFHFVWCVFFFLDIYFLSIQVKSLFILNILTFLWVLQV